MNMDPSDRRALALDRHARFDAALNKGTKAVTRVLWRLRREALRDGDTEEASYWLGCLVSLSVDSPERHLRLARMRAREYPSTSSLLDLGHSLALSGRMSDACNAYERAIELSKTSPPGLRAFDEAIVQDARQAIELINQGQLPTVVENVRMRNDPLAARYAAAYEHWRLRAKEAPSAIAFQNLGIACEGSDRFEDALEAYRKALRLAAEEEDEPLRQSLEQKVLFLSKDLNRG